MSILALLHEILSWILILMGSFFVLVGAIGTVRFPDFWSRLHAASVSDSAGMILLFLGMAMQAGFSLIAVKLAIIGAFLFITGPTSTHATANAALVSGLRPTEAEGLTGAEPAHKSKNSKKSGRSTKESPTKESPTQESRTQEPSA